MYFGSAHLKINIYHLFLHERVSFGCINCSYARLRPSCQNHFHFRSYEDPKFSQRVSFGRMY